VCVCENELSAISTLQITFTELGFLTNIENDVSSTPKEKKNKFVLESFHKLIGSHCELY
jgi:hypothetical protein